MYAFTPAVPVAHRRAWMVSALCALVVLGIAAALPQAAGAYAASAPSPIYSGATGLPDGRVYEQVSPIDKNGNQAGEPTGAELVPPYIAAAPSGESVFYSHNGPIGAAESGDDTYSVALRSATSWSTHAAIARGSDLNEGQSGIGVDGPRAIIASEDLSKIGYVNGGSPIGSPGSTGGFFLRGVTDGSLAWLSQPAIADPTPSLAEEQYATGEHLFAGGNPDLSTVYFGYSGTLAPEDDVADPALGNRSRAQQVAAEAMEGKKYNLGFYEWHEGQLESAGVLPDGFVDPYGAVPAADIQVGLGNGTYSHPENRNNEVSSDGRRAFFVSPAPELAKLAARPPELYVRETSAAGSHSTVLVSRDTLLANVNGLPAPAPSGAIAIPDDLQNESLVYASPDGSRAYFESVDRLTPEAPANGQAKEYEFDLETNSLSYLPNIAPEEGIARILASSQDGSNFIFEQQATTEALDLWSKGEVTPIAQLEARSPIVPAQSNRDGSAFVFDTPSALPGFNNAGHAEIYRYDAGENSLSCVSCPPVGVTPTSDAVMANDYYSLNTLNLLEEGLVPSRAISSDGGRVFFQTADPLVPQDANGVQDVYEWEHGTIFLISSGASPRASYFGGLSADGNDLFFSTSEGLLQGDTDGGYDVYDARVPRAGDNPPLAAVPCLGEVCQGPPSVPSLLGAPASATFSGLGNAASQTAGAAPKKKAHKAKKKRKRRNRRGKTRGSSTNAKSHSVKRKGNR